MAISTTAILTLSETKRYLQLGPTTEYDRFLVDLIDIATSKMETFCQRTFVETSHRKWLDGTGVDVMFLPDTPVTSLTRLGWERKNAFNFVGYSGDGRSARQCCRVKAVGLGWLGNYDHARFCRLSHFGTDGDSH